MNAKYLQITESVKRQIRNGDYLIDKVPSERRLADAYGVSYMTARRAVQQLVEDEIFVRGENGRLTLSPNAAGEEMRRLNVVMVLPDWPIPSLDKWRKTLHELMAERGGIVKTVYFDHGDDSVIQDALAGEFSRVFLMMPVITELIRQRLCNLRDKVVLLHHDLTEYGLTCLDASSADNMALLVDHLYRLGHRDIALINTQMVNEVIASRLEAFRRRVSELGIEVREFNFPVPPFERADLKAYQLTKEIIETGIFAGSGIVTPTIEAAIGILRGIHDSGKIPGRDISLCSYGGQETARLSIPSITATWAPDAERECRLILTDILDRRTPEKLLNNLSQMCIWQGESTGPAPVAPQTRHS